MDEKTPFSVLAEIEFLDRGDAGEVPPLGASTRLTA